MLLLDREISKKTKAGLHAKVCIAFQEDKLNSVACESVGAYLGTTTTRATIEKAFVYLAGNHSESNRKFVDHFSYDDASKVLYYVEQSIQGTRQYSETNCKKPETLIDVRVLRWNLLILSSKILEVNPDVESTEEILDSVLQLMMERLDELFGSEEVTANG